MKLILHPSPLGQWILDSQILASTSWTFAIGFEMSVILLIFLKRRTYLVPGLFVLFHIGTFLIMRIYFFAEMALFLVLLLYFVVESASSEPCSKA